MHAYAQPSPIDAMSTAWSTRTGPSSGCSELARPIDDEHGDPWLIQGVLLDITARKEAEEAQDARSGRMASIIETQREVAVTDLDVDAVMRAICERTMELTRADSATILMLEADELVVRAATGFMEDKVGARVAIEGSFPGWVYRHDQSTIQVDALVDPRSGPMAHELGMRSTVAVQLRHREKTVGQLIVISREPDFFVQDDLETLELLSVVLSSALSHAAEFESKRQQVEALARFETIYQGAAIGIALMSTEGVFLDVNPAFELMFGYTKAELRHHDVAGLHPSGGHRAQREAVPGDVGRDARHVRDREALLSARTDSWCGGTSPRRSNAGPTANRSTPSRWSRTSRSARKPSGRSPTWRTTTSSRAWRTVLASRRSSRTPSPALAGSTWPSASSSWTSTTSSS